MTTTTTRFEQGLELVQALRADAAKLRAEVVELEMRISELKQALAIGARKRGEVEAERDRLVQEKGELEEHLATAPPLAPPAQTITDLVDSLQQSSAALAKLRAAFTLAGAPKNGDLFVWASHNHNTILGLRSKLEQLVERIQNRDAARANELDEFRAAAATLPPELMPRDFGLPIDIFRGLRERALALLPPVNPSPGAPVSGA